ncbi:MAG: hypothetical protein JWQ12_1127 [Glaciihabitans sp.]|nr:hypothetical protein [Glaciihabitans sp.]
MLPSIGDHAIRAVRVGGRLASTSGAVAWGLAHPPEHSLHVHVPPNAARLRDAADRTKRLARRKGDVVIHHHALFFNEKSTALRVSVQDCLREMVLTESAEDAVAAIDSARARNRLDLIEFEELRASVPASRRNIVDASLDGVTEYLETVTRLRLARAGIPTRVQVNVLDERWIDLLIGDRLAIECDGKGKYERGATVDSDRKRDAFLEALGFHVIRLSYAMVLYDWDATLAMILAIMERGDHLAR